MIGTVHGMALRAPWYVCERGGFDRFDPRAGRPAIQKYDTDQFVQRLVEDPSASLTFDPAEDVWSFPVPRAKVTAATVPKPTLRQLLTPFRLARSNVCKLYQPSHQRFYALTVELFCETAGLPRPGPADDVEVRFVVRRLRTTFADPEGHKKDLKALARAAADEVFAEPYPDAAAGPALDPTLDTAQDLTALYALNGVDASKLAAFETKNAALIAAVQRSQSLEGWYAPPGGRGAWRKVPEGAQDPVPEAPEQEYRMWRLPADAAECRPARTRSLWFGVLPTYSGDLDSADRPKLDDRSTYVVQCIARRRQPAPRQTCPPLETTSGYSIAFRLAAFFDPTGTANRRIHVRLPDFAALAARAGTGASGGGVEFERPAGSQLPAGPLGKIPDPASGVPGGDSAETCSYAIELITIVATFVLSLFLPVVVFAFQLWWLLLLKFCWPPTQAVRDLLAALGTTSITHLNAANGQALGDVLGIADDQRAQLFTPDATAVTTDKDLGKGLVEALQPATPPPAPVPTPLPRVRDPLCERPTT